VPSNTQERYSPLKLSSIHHDFPLKHYKYLPSFNGELDGHLAEKHIQVFEHFIDIFEIEHDDASMRAFSQFLKGDAKAWFRHLQHVINYHLGNKYDGKSTAVLDMDFLPLGVSFQPSFSSDSEDCYFQQSPHILRPFYGNQQVELHENKDAVEGVKHGCCFMYVLEDPFAVLLEVVNNPNVFNFLILEFIDKFLNELIVNKFWRKHVQRNQKMDKVLSWLHWHFDFT